MLVNKIETNEKFIIDNVDTIVYNRKRVQAFEVWSYDHSAAAFIFEGRFTAPLRVGKKDLFKHFEAHQTELELEYAQYA